MERFDSKNHSRIPVLEIDEKNMRVKALGTVHNLVRRDRGCGVGLVLESIHGGVWLGLPRKDNILLILVLFCAG